MNQHNEYISETVHFKTLHEVLQDVLNETEAWAQQYEADGRYRDAAYLYGRIHSDLTEETRIVPSLAAVYEKLGDYPAAELAQAMLIETIFADGWDDTNEEHTREVNTISRLLNIFHTRLQVLGSASQTYAKMSIVYRAAVLDLEQLNIALFEQGLIVLDYFDLWNCSSLHIAARKKAPNLTRLLLQKSAHLNLKDDTGATPLHIAVGDGTEEVVQLLLIHGADTEIKDNHGNTAIQEALSTKASEALLPLLIEKGANIEARDLQGRTPLCNAIISDSPTSAGYLIRHGADINANCEDSNTLGTLLFEAVRQRKEWALKLLLEEGANLQARDVKGRRALYYAVRRGPASIVKVLLDHGATENAAAGPASTTGLTLLHCAMFEPNVTIVEMILKAGVDANGQDLVGDTALHMLMRTGKSPLKQLVNLLVKFGAQINSVNFFADTPLHVAVINHRGPEMVQLLLDAGANPHLTDIVGRTPLTLAQIQAGTSSDARDQETLNILRTHVWRPSSQASPVPEDYSSFSLRE